MCIWRKRAVALVLTASRRGIAATFRTWAELSSPTPPPISSCVVHGYHISHSGIFQEKQKRLGCPCRKIQFRSCGKFGVVSAHLKSRDLLLQWIRRFRASSHGWRLIFAYWAKSFLRASRAEVLASLSFRFYASPFVLCCRFRRFACRGWLRICRPLPSLCWRPLSPCPGVGNFMQVLLGAVFRCQQAPSPLGKKMFPKLWPSVLACHVETGVFVVLGPPGD